MTTVSMETDAGSGDARTPVDFTRWRHGVRYTYVAGCRCPDCTLANSRECYGRKLARRAERVLVDGRLVATRPGLGHGRVSTYDNWSCRCVPCTLANRRKSHERAYGRVVDVVERDVDPARDGVITTG